MPLVGSRRTGPDPLRNYPRQGDQYGVHPDYTRRYDTEITPARQIVLDFLQARLAANNARIQFLLDPSAENMTLWVDYENAALGDTE